MAVIRNLNNGSHETIYIPMAAFFCAMTCTTMVMLKFRGFKASFNLLSRNNSDKGQYEKDSDMPVLGAYRRNREEYIVGNNNNNNSITPREIKPSMVKLPPTSTKQLHKQLHSSKSTGDLSKLKITNEINTRQKTRKSTTDITESNGEQKHSKEIEKQNKTQLKLERQKINEQKKREKLAREQEKQKLKRDKDKNESQKKQQKQDTKERRTAKKKPPAPLPPVNSSPQIPVQYSSNTLESSISRSSGPPPYSAVPEVVPNQNDNTGNTSFGKPVDGPSSWDLISHHRQQLRRPMASQSGKTKSTVLDLNYNVDVKTSVGDKDNSEV